MDTTTEFPEEKLYVLGFSDTGIHSKYQSLSKPAIIEIKNERAVLRDLCNNCSASTKLQEGKDILFMCNRMACFKNNLNVIQSELIKILKFNQFKFYYALHNHKEFKIYGKDGNYILIGRHPPISWPPRPVEPTRPVVVPVFSQFDTKPQNEELDDGKSSFPPNAEAKTTFENEEFLNRDTKTAPKEKEFITHFIVNRFGNRAIQAKYKRFGTKTVVKINENRISFKVCNSCHANLNNFPIKFGCTRKLCRDRNKQIVESALKKILSENTFEILENQGGGQIKLNGGGRNNYVILRPDRTAPISSASSKFDLGGVTIQKTSSPFTEDFHNQDIFNPYQSYGISSPITSDFEPSFFDSSNTYETVQPQHIINQFDSTNNHDFDSQYW